ncbi:MAG: hypothetical protein V5A72_00035 [Candidatus Nanohaloarchaea archaeon]
MNEQKWVIRGVSAVFLIMTLLIINDQVNNLLYIATVGLGFFLFGYVERLLEEKGGLKTKR